MANTSRPCSSASLAVISELAGGRFGASSEQVVKRCASRMLGLPPDKQCQYLMALGWPANPDDLTRAPRAGGRKDYDDVCHAERWGQH